MPQLNFNVGNNGNVHRQVTKRECLPALIILMPSEFNIKENVVNNYQSHQQTFTIQLFTRIIQ